MKDNYQKIESNFGQITIFKKSEDKNSKNSIKSRRNFKSKKLVQSQPDTETEANVKEDLNYFDKQLVGNYFEKKEIEEKTATTETPSLSKTSTNIRTKTEELDFIDEFYFKPHQVPELSNETKNITKHDLDSQDPSLNYIDQITLKNITSNQDDGMIGSIYGLKKDQNQKNKQNKEITIPIIEAENLSERNEKATKKNFNSKNLLKNNKSNKNLKESDHKKLNDEVPKWDYITKDEAVKILKSHVCYFNEERKFNLCRF
jgi:hypothetical protein